MLRITQKNIGPIRRFLMIRGSWMWNALMRDITARLEGSGKIIGAFFLILFLGACVDSGLKHNIFTALGEPECYLEPVLIVRDCDDRHQDRDFMNGGTNGGSKNGHTNGGSTGSNGPDNNGFGNGDQDAPGRSGDHNRAENNRDSRSDPSHGGNAGGQGKK